MMSDVHGKAIRFHSAIKKKTFQRRQKEFALATAKEVEEFEW